VIFKEEWIGGRATVTIDEEMKYSILNKSTGPSAQPWAISGVISEKRKVQYIET